MKPFKLFFTILVIAIAFSSCTYDFIIPKEIVIVDPDDPNAPQISFAIEIVPIFENSCTACHDGGQNPDLRAENAFSSLNSTRYLNCASPEESLIYTKADPNAGGSHKKYTATQAALVLSWIQQGAKNN